MSVICIYLDKIMPINEPIINPTIIHSIFVSVYLIIVITIAKSIATEDILFPVLAVAGEASLFIPIINNAAEIK
jgi:hypothetical protein